jgi:hypothetical protein
MKKTSTEFGEDLIQVRNDMQEQGGLPKRQTGEPELALFVIWQKARPFQDEILQSIASVFEIRGVHEVTWTPDRVDENFARFYQGPAVPPYGFYFQGQKGGGPFLVVTVVDYEPLYEERQTHRGPEVLNARCFDVKQNIRKRIGGVMRVHSTDSAAEAARDLLLLLGMTAEQYLARYTQEWNGDTVKVRRNLTGADGWESMAELLEVLNHGVRYIVMRNFEDLPDSYVVGPHLDVDLLTDNYFELVRLLNARPLHKSMPKWGGRFLGKVDGSDVLFDLRFIGDGYYDKAWAQRLLERRNWQAGGFFGPAADDYFESLAYHAIVHKQGLAEDYRERLQQMAEDLGRSDWNASELADFGIAIERLNSMMAERGFSHVRPLDPTVFYNFRPAGYSMPWIRRKLAGIKRRAFVRWSRFTYIWRYSFTGLRRNVMRWFPWLRLLRPRYRRLVTIPQN